MSAPRGTQPPSPYTVLHVDDDPDQLKLVKRYLETTLPALHVRSTLSPGEALQTIGDPPDCILSDYKMPEMNGIQLTQKIRETSSVPIIIYTGSEEVAEAAFEAGVDDYIRKEHDAGHYRVLAERIRAAVEKHRAEGDLRGALAHYRALFDSVSDAILLIDPEDNAIVSANRAALTQSAMGGEGLVGSPCYEVLHHRSSPCEAPDCVCPVRETLETGQSATVVHTHYDVDGNPVYDKVSTHPVKDADGNITQILHVRLQIEKQVSDNIEAAGKIFEAKTRYLASSLIVTVPMRIVRELELDLGETVRLQIHKQVPISQPIEDPAILPPVRREHRT